MNSTEKPTSPIKVTEFYQQRLSATDNLIDSLEQQSLRFSRFRGGSFFCALASLILAATADGWNNLFYLLAAAFFSGFVWLIVVHEQLIAKINTAKLRRKIHRLQLARMARDWRHIPDSTCDIPDEFKTVSSDLGLFGHASLFALIARCHTPFGIRTLVEWILQPPSTKEIQHRQEAVRQLARESRFLEELELKGRLLASSESGPDEFVNWAESGPWLQPKIALVWTTRLLTLLMILTLVGAFMSFVSQQLIIISFFLLLLGNISVNVIFAGRIHEIFDAIDSKSSDISHYGTLFRMIDTIPAEGTWVADLKHQMGSSEAEPTRLLKSLAKQMRIANFRKSPVLGLLYFVMQLLFLWDFHALQWLEIWQQHHGKKVRSWFDGVAKLEAIASLATVLHDNPTWTFPEFKSTNEETTVVAKQLAHPYLTYDSAVANDVTVGPAGTMLLVTGSNMSGKSTLLRSIGVNVVLAQMGAPVCAESFSLVRLNIATSMRVQDSLEDGVSFFMAELNQLKQTVDRSEEYRSKDETLLFLLDEILQGTNSVERHIAVASVVHRLVQNGAIGAVSTHDLELANHPDLAPLCKTVHFRETIQGDENDGSMTFDYKMHPGLATTTNALKLLRLVGLSETDA